MEQTELIAGAGQVLAQSQALAVKTPATRQQAADYWDAIVAFRKQNEELKEAECRPLKSAWEDAKKPYDDFKKKCETAEAKLKAAMSDWDREQERIAREEQAKIQAKIDAENAKKLAKAEEKGKDLSEVVLKVAPVVQAPPKAIETQAGTTQQRSVKKVYEATDLKTLMRDFPTLFDLNTARFNAAAKAGMFEGRTDVTVREEYVYSQR